MGVLCDATCLLVVKCLFFILWYAWVNFCIWQSQLLKNFPTFLSRFSKRVELYKNMHLKNVCLSEFENWSYFSKIYDNFNSPHFSLFFYFSFQIKPPEYIINSPFYKNHTEEVKEYLGLHKRTYVLVFCLYWVLTIDIYVSQSTLSSIWLGWLSHL